MTAFENLSASFQVIAPLILYMGTGILLRHSRIVPATVFPSLNTIVFYVSLPLVCMRNVMTSSIDGLRNAPVILLELVLVSLLISSAILVVPRIIPDTRRNCVVIQSLFRPNDAIFGLSIVASLFGTTPVMSLSIAIFVPLMNAVSVLLMERIGSSGNNLYSRFLHILLNPLILGCLLGFLFRAFGVHSLPGVLQTATDGLANLCTPLAFLALGGMLSMDSLEADRRIIAAVTALRLIPIPLIATLCAATLGFRGESLMTVCLFFGAPIATATLPIAKESGADAVLQAELIASTSLFSILTAFLFIFFCKQAGWI